MKKGEKKKYLIIGIIVITILLIVYLVINNLFHGDIIFSFGDEYIELKVGDSYSISYQLEENINIIWESDNEDAVIVSDGVITAVNLGSATIKGTVIKNDQEITSSCQVTTYYGDKNISLNEIVIPEGDLFITKGGSYQLPLSYKPDNSYVNAINYEVKDPSIVTIDNEIRANNIGVTEITIKVNNITKTITVHVIEKEIKTAFLPKIESVEVEENITLKPQDTRKIEYKIEPEKGFIESIKWESSNENVATVENGIIKAKESGETIIKVIINNTIIKETKVLVKVPVTGISIKTNPNLVLKVGEQLTINASVLPSNATNKKINYTSNNSNIMINENGKITALSAGNGTITIKSDEENKQGVISYTVNPIKGLVNGAGGVWGYTSSIDKTPTRADKSFFQNLAIKGIGVLNGNTYIYTKGNKTYKYDISTSTLYMDNKSALMRMYYPTGVDLSEVNTFTFFSGTGEIAKNFGGYQNHLDQNRSEMSSSGIIILVSTPTGLSYDSEDAILSTEFVKNIVNQKSGVKNAIGGYSGSGEAAGKAANNGNYDRLIICHSYFKAAYTPNVKNKEIIIYSPNGDFMVNQTTTTLNNMKIQGYTNVTVVTNNSSLNSYSSHFLVINPGNKMGTGHGYANISNAKVFSYACR